MSITVRTLKNALKQREQDLEREREAEKGFRESWECAMNIVASVEQDIKELEAALRLIEGQE